MKIATDRFGELEADEKTLLHLKNGLIGLPNVKRVLLLEHKVNSPFRWIQAVDDPGLALPVVDPLLLVWDYPMEDIRKALTVGNRKPVDVAVAAIATVPPPPGQITVNLVAPVVFDVETRTGDQIVLTDKRFTTRHVLATKQDDDKVDDKTPDTSDPSEESAKSEKPE